MSAAALEYVLLYGGLPRKFEPKDADIIIEDILVCVYEGDRKRKTEREIER